MASIWTLAAKLPQFETLSGDVDTDILIIGGGMAGLLCAGMLDRAGADYLLVEQNRICSGVTQNTTAKLTVQHGLIYNSMLRRFGTQKTGQYLHANERALQLLGTMCRNIDCDFEETDNYLCASGTAASAEAAALRLFRANAELVTQLPAPIPGQAAVRLPKQAQFHPLKFIAEIAEGLNIREHTKVRELIGTTAVTAQGRIRANKIVIATHFPMLNKHGSYFLKLYQQRSYVLALKNAMPLHGMYLDTESGLSFRSCGELLLLGGGGHRTGKRGGGWDALRCFAAEHFPQADEVAHWAAQDCMTLDGIPYVGKYSAQTDGLYVVTGFNKWGMVSSMTAAMLLCDLLQGRDNPCAEVFSPSRSILRPQLAVNAAESAIGLLTPAKKRCPHMGCALHWNEAERSWDCACHGSRFAEDGTLLNNPATDDLP